VPKLVSILVKQDLLRDLVAVFDLFNSHDL